MKKTSTSCSLLFLYPAAHQKGLLLCVDLPGCVLRSVRTYTSAFFLNVRHAFSPGALTHTVPKCYRGWGPAFTLAAWWRQSQPRWLKAELLRGQSRSCTAGFAVAAVWREGERATAGRALVL